MSKNKEQTTPKPFPQGSGRKARAAVILGAIASGSLLAACDRPPPQPERPPTPKPIASNAPIASANPSAPENQIQKTQKTQKDLPPGVIAEAKGISGSLIRVEEADEFRILTIDGVLHAARRNRGEYNPFSPFADGDPMVRLLLAARDAGISTALLIGLGSGATATELRSAGKKVDVVEIEPAVIDFAKRFFDYKGEAVAADGVEHLKQGSKTYDAVILDAFAGTKLPSRFVEPSAVAALKKRINRRGVAVVRMLARPSDPDVSAAVNGIGGAFAHRRLLASGAGDEEQNIYLIASDAPLNLIYFNELSLWPIPIPAAGAPSSPEGIKAALLSKAPQKIALAGYLVRAEDGSLSLDLPHWEMGSRRYALRGPDEIIKELDKRLPRKTKFVTAGDLSTDGNLATTLYAMLGGGGVKLSLVRFSPVVAAVSGTLRERTEPYAGPGKPGEVDLSGPGRPTKLAKGIGDGVRAEIVIEKIHFTIDLPAWKSLRQGTTRPFVARAVAAATKGQLGQAAVAVREILGALDKKLGSFGPRMVAYDELLVMHEALSANANQNTTAGAQNAFDRAAACDRADNAFRLGYASPLYTPDSQSRDVLPIDEALLACAERGYSAVVNDPTAGGDLKTKAAARLVSVLEDKLFEIPAGQDTRSKPVEAQIQALKEKFGVKADDKPPP